LDDAKESLIDQGILKSEVAKMNLAELLDEAGTKISSFLDTLDDESATKKRPAKKRSYSKRKQAQFSGT
jgi:hypothetical protein